MKISKKLTAFILSAALAVFCGLPRSGASAARETSDAYAESASYSYIDSTDYKRWTGTSELKANTSYYIDSTVKITEEKSVTLPEGSRLLIKDKGSLLIYTGSSFSLDGELVIEPSGNLTSSGTFTAAQGSRVLNYGTFSGTKSSVFQVSSDIITGNTGITVFSGEVNVYRTGTLVSFNRLTFSENSEVTVTGGVISERNALIFFKGGFSVTMNGSVISNGSLYLYCNMAVSGDITLGAGSKYYKTGGAEMKFTKSGTITDNRRDPVPEGSAPDESEAGDILAPSEYDEASEQVEWKGIDVSRYQGAIDWSKVKASGIDFVILRSSIGDGSTDTSGEDIRFSYNAVAAKKAGLMVGAYHYLWAETVEDAIKEARFFIKTISPYVLDFPAVLDFEDPSQQNDLTNAERTAIAKAFLKEVKDAGYFPMLYTNRSWATHYLDMNELSEYEVWLAEWFSSPSYTGEYGIWQYTASGRVAGIEGDVDLDLSFKNYRKLILDGGYNHLR